ncbi:cation:proton antiporter regulatory subunit [Salimicrobium halophilum]|uniref:Potassium/proton antiporter regulatory subunit, CPA2 family n=1 Tax=Salimicrobium halophilum TaxID=86666 RepID=A0A1G8VAM3_9BACI|nr:TrkA C-terminal domain-containing protein [Salimicrobium halophilum]SDJ63118.1 potassium/proton antiporter regulatory subunit, CPA2 family [Salimicrobium halophilum]
MNISVSQLPGIGQKISFKTAENSQIVLIVHHTGKRELYLFDDADNEEADFAIDLTADETRELGAQFLGATYQPVSADKLKMFKNSIVIDWIELRAESVLAGKTIEESEIRNRTGATIIGIVQGDETIAIPEADQVLSPGNVLMAIGKQEQLDVLQAMCQGEEG